jgi:hypothetical protein
VIVGGAAAAAAVVVVEAHRAVSVRGLRGGSR